MKTLIQSIILLAIAPFIVFNPAFWVYVGLHLLLERIEMFKFKAPKEWKEWSKDAKNRFTSIVSWFPHKTTCAARDFSSDQRYLFVGNHNLYSSELFLVIASIYRETGIWPRFCADSAHGDIPVWKHLLAFIGAIKPEQIQEAMAEGYPLLIFPGSSNESLRSKVFQPYNAIWENRTTFARQALEHGYKIVPAATIGCDDNFIRLFDIPGKFLFSSAEQPLSKYVCLPMVLPLPRQRVYINIGVPIDTAKMEKNDKNVVTLRDSAKKAVSLGILSCKQLQHEDPKRYFWSRGE